MYKYVMYYVMSHNIRVFCNEKVKINKYYSCRYEPILIVFKFNLTTFISLLKNIRSCIYIYIYIIIVLVQ
jgi:hypothetical protein